MAMPILVCLGTTAVLELRRMATRGDEGKALDELRASEQKLTKLVQAMEKELAKEKAATATASDRAASLAATSEALRRVQGELRERAQAAEAAAGQERRRAEAAERAAEQARRDALAAADKLEAALEGLKKDVAKALAKFARGGFGAAIGGANKRGGLGWLPGRSRASNAEAFLEHMKKLGVEVDATPAELDALASAAAAAEAEAKAKARAAESESTAAKKSLPPSSASSSSSVPRLELSVDAATWARQLRLVCDDPVRIARALAVNGAASPAIGAGGAGARSAAAATALNPAVAAAAATATATVPLPFQRAVRSPPKPKQRSLPSSPVRKENAVSGGAGGEQQQAQQQQRQRAPASPPKPPQIEPESPRPAAGRRFVLRTNVNEGNAKKASSSAPAGHKAIGASSSSGKAGGRVGVNLSLKLEEEAAGLLSSSGGVGGRGGGGDFDGLSRSIVPR